MKYKQILVLRLFMAFLVIGLGTYFFDLLIYPIIYIIYFLFLPYNPEIIGSSIIVNNYELLFISSCVASSAYILLSILLLLTKDIDFKKGIKIFLTGFFILFFVNILRIFLLGIILIKENIVLFEKLHLLFWDVFSTAFVFLLWLFLIKYYKIKAIPIYSDFDYLRKRIKIV